MTPIHYFLSSGSYKSIVLSPLALSRPNHPPIKPRVRRELVISGPYVLLATRLELNHFDKNDWFDWILDCPRDAAKVQLEGWWGILSTLLIIRIPVRIWHAIAPNPDVSCIGYVTGENMAFVGNESTELVAEEIQGKHDASSLLSRPSPPDQPNPVDVGRSSSSMARSKALYSPIGKSKLSKSSMQQDMHEYHSQKENATTIITQDTEQENINDLFRAKKSQLPKLTSNEREIIPSYLLQQDSLKNYLHSLFDENQATVKVCIRLMQVILLSTG
jgi:hypothetical protein